MGNEAALDLQDNFVQSLDTQAKGRRRNWIIMADDWQFAPDPDWDQLELSYDKKEDGEEMIPSWVSVTACALLATWKTMLLLWIALDLLVLDDCFETTRKNRLNYAWNHSLNHSRPWLGSPRAWKRQGRVWRRSGFSISSRPWLWSPRAWKWQARYKEEADLILLMIGNLPDWDHLELWNDKHEDAEEAN